MPSSYTSSLRLTLPVTGENPGTWGDLVNDGITSLVDSSVAGYAAVTMTNADYTLTTVNGAADESRKMMLNISGTLTAARNVICPTASKLYFVKNATTGGFAITLKTAAGTGVSIPNGAIAVLMCDGTNVNPATNALIGDNSATGTAAGTVRVTGGANSSTGAGGPVAITGGSSVSSTGGAVTIAGGVTTATGTSGAVNILGGAASIANTPGAVVITGGVGSSNTAITAGAAVNITGGASGAGAGGTGGGGAVNINGGIGNTSSTASVGGGVFIAAGAAGLAGASGANVGISASNGVVNGAATVNGGSVNITSGTGFTSGASGSVNISAPGNSATGSAIVFSNGGTESARIDKAGNFGINTATPNSDLHLNGSLALPSNGATTTYTVVSTDLVLRCQTGSFTLTLPTASNFVGRILIVYSISSTVASAASDVYPLGSTTLGTSILTTGAKFAMLQSISTGWQTIMAN